MSFLRIGKKDAIFIFAVAALSLGFASRNQLELRKPRPSGASGTANAYAAIVNVSTNASGEVTIHYPSGKFTAPPNLAITVQFNESGHAHMGRVNVVSNTESSVTISVLTGNGAACVGAVQISYVAIQ